MKANAIDEKLPQMRCRFLVPNVAGRVLRDTPVAPRLRSRRRIQRNLEKMRGRQLHDVAPERLVAEIRRTETQVVVNAIRARRASHSGELQQDGRVGREAEIVGASIIVERLYSKR